MSQGRNVVFPATIQLRTSAGNLGEKCFEVVATSNGFQIGLGFEIDPISEPLFYGDSHCVDGFEERRLNLLALFSWSRSRNLSVARGQEDSLLAVDIRSR